MMSNQPQGTQTTGPFQGMGILGPTAVIIPTSRTSDSATIVITQQVIPLNEFSKINYQIFVNSVINGVTS